MSFFYLERLKMKETVTKVRKIFYGHSSMLLCLPVDFVHKTGLVKGDEVVVSYTDQVLTLMPNPDRIMNSIKGEPKPCQDKIISNT